jgi:lipid-A-disaccharide synthase
MCLIFPFEEEIYRKAGVSARFVGHPLLERVAVSLDRAAFFRRYELDADRPLVTLLPGSRRSEVRFHMPVLIETAARLASSGSRQFVLPLAEDLDPASVEPFIAASKVPIRLLRQDHYEAMAHADIVLSSCGTANLETALLGTPFVAFYRLSGPTYMAGRPFVKVPHFSIVNILAGERVVPELIQRDFTAASLAREAEAILGSAGTREAMRARFAAIRGGLGKESASLGVARELDALVSNG